MKIIHYGLMGLLAAALLFATAGPASARASQSQDALAAAARRAREQQKSQPKTSKVWDDDNIPKAGNLDVIGPASPAASASAENSGAKSTAAQSANVKETASKAGPKKQAKQKSDLEAQLKSAQAGLKQAETDLDFTRRKYALDQQSFYQNPNYSSDTSGAAALQDEKAQIDAKQQAVQAAKDKVDDLQAKLASAGSSGSDSNQNSAN